eukprot:c6754_g1_i1.p1 GENE.c6754_g1_i1~~c6754_g1_i1.p1  ORF type:complete len:1114 (-),score=222.57 c6754_g1_i1:21-3362(-)
MEKTVLVLIHDPFETQFQRQRFAPIGTKSNCTYIFSNSPNPFELDLCHIFVPIITQKRVDRLSNDGRDDDSRLFDKAFSMQNKQRIVLYPISESEVTTTAPDLKRSLVTRLKESCVQDPSLSRLESVIQKMQKDTPIRYPFPDDFVFECFRQAQSLTRVTSTTSTLTSTSTSTSIPTSTSTSTLTLTSTSTSLLPPPSPSSSSSTDPSATSSTTSPSLARVSDSTRTFIQESVVEPSEFEIFLSARMSWALSHRVLLDVRNAEFVVTPDSVSQHQDDVLDKIKLILMNSFAVQVPVQRSKQITEAICNNLMKRETEVVLFVFNGTLTEIRQPLATQLNRITQSVVVCLNDQTGHIFCIPFNDSKFRSQSEIRSVIMSIIESQFSPTSLAAIEFVSSAVDQRLLDWLKHYCDNEPEPQSTKLTSHQTRFLFQEKNKGTFQSLQYVHVTGLELEKMLPDETTTDFICFRVDSTTCAIASVDPHFDIQIWCFHRTDGKGEIKSQISAKRFGWRNSTDYFFPKISCSFEAETYGDSEVADVRSQLTELSHLSPSEDLYSISLRRKLQRQISRDCQWLSPGCMHSPLARSALQIVPVQFRALPPITPRRDDLVLYLTTEATVGDVMALVQTELQAYSSLGEIQLVLGNDWLLISDEPRASDSFWSVVQELSEIGYNQAVKFPVQVYVGQSIELKTLRHIPSLTTTTSTETSTAISITSPSSTTSPLTTTASPNLSSSTITTRNTRIVAMCSSKSIHDLLWDKPSTTSKLKRIATENFFGSSCNFSAKVISGGIEATVYTSHEDSSIEFKASVREQSRTGEQPLVIFDLKFADNSQPSRDKPVTVLFDLPFEVRGQTSLLYFSEQSERWEEQPQQVYVNARNQRQVLCSFDHFSEFCLIGRPSSIDITPLADSRWDKTFPESERDVKFWRGGRPYYVAVGFQKSGVRVDRFEELYQSWCVGYHGTKPSSVLPILQNGFDMNRKPLDNHWQLGETHFEIHNFANAVFVSPSYVYAGLYGTFYWNSTTWVISSKVDATDVLQVLIQVRVNPAALVSGNTENRSIFPSTFKEIKDTTVIQPNISFDEMEWRITDVANVKPYAVLLRSMSLEEFAGTDPRNVS